MIGYIKLNGETKRCERVVFLKQPRVEDLSMYDFCCDIDMNNAFEAFERDFPQASVKPPKQSSIYMPPKCPVPIADIRRNYTLKRHPNEGDYNVLNPWQGCKRLFMLSYLWVENRSALVINNDDPNYDWNDIYYKAKNLMPDLDPNDKMWFNNLNSKCKRGQHTLFLSRDRYFRMVYENALTKPVVSYRDLILNDSMPLTADVCRLVYETARVSCNEKNALDNFRLQMKALNQYDWRNYPGTMHLLFDEMLSWVWEGHTCGFVKKHIKQESKNIRIIFETKFDETFKSKDDERVAKELLTNILGLNQMPVFRTQEEWNMLLSRNSVYSSTVDKLFNITVRVTDKN